MLALNKLLSVPALSVWLFLLSLASYAEATDNKILINADYMKLNTQTGDSIYTGNVSFVQGDIKLSGEKIIVRSSNNEISQVEVEGKPAHYMFTDKSAGNDEGKPVNARSEHMEYSVAQHRLIMTINARLEQTDNVVESQRIVYDTENQEVLAGSDNSDTNTGERVNITLTPNKKP
jgi:lipopolysaccharide transport protein LptA